MSKKKTPTDFEKAEEQLQIEKIEEMKKILHRIPRNITVNELRLAYIEHVMELHEYNRTSAAAELGLNYTTIMAMIRRGEIRGGRSVRGRPKNEV
jgi:transcriptional regulator with PAS, ATPase and Fis domain